MDDVHCTGSETHLVNCSYDSITSEDHHGEDAGVRCFSENGNNTKTFGSMYNNYIHRLTYISY